MPALLCFRRDLRLSDLPALLAAADVDGDALACYVLDPRLTTSAGTRRLQYLDDALRALRDALDGRLLVTGGHPKTLGRCWPRQFRLRRYRSRSTSRPSADNATSRWPTRPGTIHLPEFRCQPPPPTGT